MSFKNLNVKTEIIRALKDESIEVPTKIQEKSIPLIKEGRDLIGKSKTGSGKTAAFAVPIIEMISPNKGLQVLIITPTRELAFQISGEIKKFGKNLNLYVATVFGGVSINPQISAIKKANIVVGTPGRLLDHLSRGTLNLSKISCFVLDEADKMIEMGFIEDIEKILKRTPKKKQMLLFGATISQEISYLKEKYMHNPKLVQTQEHVGRDYLEQFYYDVSFFEKFSLLVHLLKKRQTERSIIFCSTRKMVDIVSKNLKKQEIKSARIHGKLSQNKRMKEIDRFNREKTNILVASAVAARGLDIRNVSHVFNFDLSQDPQEYVHRIGRTARAGKKGKAITLLSQEDHPVFRNINERYSFEVKSLPKEKFKRLYFDTKINSKGFKKQRFNQKSYRYAKA